jgi:predicted membrane protein
MKELIDHIKAIATAKTKFTKLELIEDGAKLSSNLIFSLILTLGIFLITLLLAIVMLISLSVYLNNYVIGSVITFSFFTIVLGICYIYLKSKIQESITNKVYQKLVDEDIDSELKFQATKKIEDLKVAYHEKEAFDRVEAILEKVETSATVLSTVAHLIKKT